MKFCFLILTAFFLPVSIYTISFNDVTGASHSFNAYSGKKMLIVNIASNSSHADQIGEMERLQQEYRDSLVVVAFPSNSFGNEPLGDVQIKKFCDSVYHATFLIAAKGNVTGSGKQPTYDWLTSASLNGVSSGNVNGDFQKYLIDGEGEIIGVFAPSVKPTDNKIRKAISGK
jgi:glutathione peroxidase